MKKYAQTFVTLETNSRENEKQAMMIWKNSSSTHKSDLPADFTTTPIDPGNDSLHKLVFYEHIRLTMVAKCILGSILISSRKTLFTKRKDFTWMENTTGEYNYN